MKTASTLPPDLHPRFGLSPSYDRRRINLDANAIQRRRIAIQVAGAALDDVYLLNPIRMRLEKNDELGAASASGNDDTRLRQVVFLGVRYMRWKFLVPFSSVCDPDRLDPAVLIFFIPLWRRGDG